MRQVANDDAQHHRPQYKYRRRHALFWSGRWSGKRGLHLLILRFYVLATTLCSRKNYAPNVRNIYYL